MAGFRSSVLTVSFAAALSVCLQGQDSIAGIDPLLPPTKLEAFQPPVGSIFTIAYDEMGTVGSVRVELREVRDTGGKPIRGLIVEVPGPDGPERSYVDVDELAGLLRGCDALLQVGANPTPFKTYEARYATRGSLELTASTKDDKGTLFSVTVGRFRTARTTSPVVLYRRHCVSYTIHGRIVIL